MSGFAQRFDAARAHRTAARVAEAEQAYSDASEEARSDNDPMALAHALRHVSDLARERGAAAEALSCATEAVAIYRSQADARPLDLANALRLNALALNDSGRPDEAKPLWEEARDVYASVGVQAGVDEAKSQLARI